MNEGLRFGGPRNPVLATAWMLLRPTTCHRGWRERYGDPWSVPLLTGRVLLSADPQTVKELCLIQARSQGAYGADPVERALGPGSLFSTRGKAHRHRRSVASCLFGRASLDDHRSIIEDISRASLERRADAGPFLARDLANEITLRVILRLLFGARNPREVEELERAVHAFYAALSPVYLFSPGLAASRLGRRIFRRFEHGRSHLQQLLLHKVVRAQDDDSFLGHLTRAYLDDQLDRRDVVADLLAFLFAGHETSSLTLQWAIDFLGRAPDSCDRLRTELDETAESPWLEAVIQEVLRLRPAAAAAIHTLSRPARFRGVELPAGLGVGVSIYDLHRDESLYPRPERFMGRSYGPFEYMPFGFGTRRCLGANLAELELSLILTVLLREYRFDLADLRPARPKAMGFFVGPHHGVPMRLQKRRMGARPSGSRQPERTS